MNFFDRSFYKRAGILGGLLGATVFGYAWFSTPQNPGSAPPPGEKTALTVNPVEAEIAEWPRFLSASGSISAWQEAVVGSEIGGLRLAEINVDVGDSVRKGQLLARLQSETVHAEREQTRASLAEAQAALREAQENARRARKIQDSGALSAQQTEQYLIAEVSAKARVDGLTARLKFDDLRLAQTRITAPDDGTVSQRLATLGSVVLPGQELFRLIRQDRLEWRAEMPAAELARVRQGMPVTLLTADKTRMTGRVRTVAPTIDPKTRNGLIYVDLEGEKNGAGAGMFASGEIELGRERVLTLPQSAVLMRDGYHYVFRLGPDNRVIETKTGVGQRRGDRIEMTPPFDATTRVVASGVGFLNDGDRVRVMPMPEDVK